MRKATMYFLFFLLPAITFCQARPSPTKAQKEWHNMEYYFFAHFGPNTFTGKEWGHGDEVEDLFNPSDLDCRQWCKIAKQSGAAGIIITAKHHDGFCLWPSKYSKHTVRESKWKNGKGDVLKELSEACKEYGLKFGVYLSPWDRNHPDYGTAAYNDVYVHMMKEVFENYGPIWELWWDGANGEGPNGKKQVYDWDRFKQTARTISPQTVIFSDVGPDCRWVGNEKGIAGTTNWNYLNIEGFAAGADAPITDTLNQGNVLGKSWVPAECDVSIRPGWFFHEEENSQVKSAESLFQLYLKSVGRGGNLLLNIPPDTRGQFRHEDSTALVNFKEIRKKAFATNLIDRSTFRDKKTDKTAKNRAKIPYTNTRTIKINSTQQINCIALLEDMRKGQEINDIQITLWLKGKMVKEIKATTVGRKRILTFEKVATNKIIIVSKSSYHPHALAAVEAYAIEENWEEKN